MADGTTGKYAQNANQAAAGAPQCQAGGCPSCIKTGLPILLARPGLAEKKYAGGKQGTIKPLLPGVADPSLSYSGYVMRTLRAGYVYAYYEQAHTPEIKSQKGWQAFQVDGGGYLTPYPINELPLPGGAPTFSCQRTDGYAAAMLFVIPDAKNTKRVWVGFSETPWSPKVLNAYAKSETLRNQRMAHINAPSAACERSIPLTEANIGQGLADYDANYGAAFTALRGIPYELKPPARGGAPNKRHEGAQDVYAQAKVIVERGKQFDIGKAMIVSVPDAIGVTHEAAQLRIELPQKAKGMLLAKDKNNNKVDGNWRLQSALSIKAVIETLQQQYSNLGSQPGMPGDPNKYMPRDQFDAMKAAGTLPSGATFMPQTFNAAGGGMFPGGTYTNPSLGIVAIPQDELPAVQVQKKVGDAYQKYIDQYNQACQEDSDLLAKIEVDYGTWLTSAPRKLVTEHDFDETTRQDGVYYAQVVDKVTFGGPITDVGTRWYADFMQDDPNQKNNILVRAMLGNQKDFFDWFKDTDQRSKTIDSVKALFDVIEELEAHHKGGELVGSLARNLPLLRSLASAWSSLLIPVAGAAGLALSKLKKASPTMLMKLETTIARISMMSVQSGDIKITRVQATEQQAKVYWREVAKASHEGPASKTTRKAGDVEITSVTKTGAFALDLSGPGGNMHLDAFVFEQATTATTAVAVQLPSDLEQVRNLARKVGKVLKEGGAVLSAAGGWLQILSFQDALEKLQGNDETRREGMLSLCSATLGSAAALMEISQAFAKEWEKVALVTGFKIVAGAASAVATAFDAVAAGLKVVSTFGKDETATTAAYFAQTIFFAGATAAGTLGALQVAGIISATGFGLSWTGWGLLLVALGVAAGYIAQLLQNTPSEDWAARTIWGNASDKWGTFTKEQEEMNKLLLGIGVDFSYRDGLGSSLWRSISSAGMGEGLMAPGNYNPAQYREAWLQLKLAKPLRDKLNWAVHIYGRGRDGSSTLVAERGSGLLNFPGNAAAVLKGVSEGHPDIKDDGATLSISAELDILTYSGAFAKVQIKTKEGEVLVDENLP